MTLAAYPAGDPPSERIEPPDSRLKRPLRLERLDRLDRLDRRLLAGPVDEVARALLGTLIVRDAPAGRCVARIVETEAYGGPEDRASHARAGRTARTGVMFGPPGRAYVYLVYGLHHCLNIVCGEEGLASAVLVRAVEPWAGVELMRERRGRIAEADERLGAGPARTCQALDIDRSLDGIDLILDARLWLAAGAPAGSGIVSGPRVGVAYAGAEWGARPWRFGLTGHASLSRPFPSRL